VRLRSSAQIAPRLTPGREGPPPAATLGGHGELLLRCNSSPGIAPNTCLHMNTNRTSSDQKSRQLLSSGGRGAPNGEGGDVNCYADGGPDES
jgi:hypothetical protein